MHSQHLEFVREGLLNCKHFCMLRKLSAISSQSRLHRKWMYGHGELDLLLLLLLPVSQCQNRVAKCLVEGGYQA